MANCLSEGYQKAQFAGIVVILIALILTTYNQWRAGQASSFTVRSLTAASSQPRSTVIQPR